MVRPPKMVPDLHRRCHQIEIPSPCQARLRICVDGMAVPRPMVRTASTSLVQCGVSSTVQLTANLCQREHEYITLKVYETGNRQGANEITVLEHLRPLLVRDGGNRLVRSFIGSFEIHGAVGPHACLTHKPLCLSLKELRRCAGCQLHHSLLKPLIYGVLCGLDYFHRRANIVHTGEAAFCSKECLRCSWY